MLAFRLVTKSKENEEPITYKKSTYRLIWPEVFCTEKSDIHFIMKLAGQRLFIASFKLAGLTGEAFTGLDAADANLQVRLLLAETIADPVLRTAEISRLTAA